MSLHWKSTVSLVDKPKPAVLPPVVRPAATPSNFKDFCFQWSSSTKTRQSTDPSSKPKVDALAARVQAMAAAQRLARAQMAKAAREREGPQPSIVVAEEVAAAAKAAQEQFLRQALEKAHELQQEARLQAADILSSGFTLTCESSRDTSQQQSSPIHSDVETASTASATCSDSEDGPSKASVSPTLVAVAVAEASKPEKPRPTPYVKPPPKSSQKGPGPRWHVPGELVITASVPVDTTKFNWVAPKMRASTKTKRGKPAWGSWNGQSTNTMI